MAAAAWQAAAYSEASSSIKRTPAASRPLPCRYVEHAWGHDELAPVSKTGKDGFGGLGATIIDSLDTLLMMGELMSSWPMAYACMLCAFYLEGSAQWHGLCLATAAQTSRCNLRKCGCRWKAVSCGAGELCHGGRRTVRLPLSTRPAGPLHVCAGMKEEYARALDWIAHEMEVSADFDASVGGRLRAMGAGCCAMLGKWVLRMRLGAAFKSKQRPAGSLWVLYWIEGGCDWGSEKRREVGEF